MTDAEAVLCAVQNFFREKTSADTKWSLFEIACLGNPEKGIQGELFLYLRHKLKPRFPVIEYGWRTRNIDIVVFDETHLPQVCIELKHYSANQGSISTLLSGGRFSLDRDLLKEYPPVPLIQVALFTAVHQATQKKATTGSSGGPVDYTRFLQSYVFKDPNKPKLAPRDYEQKSREAFALWLADTPGMPKKRYIMAGVPGTPACEHDLVFPEVIQQFDAGGYRLSGRINYFAGLITAEDRQAYVSEVSSLTA